MSKFQQLKTRRMDDHKTIKRLKGAIAENDRESASHHEGYKTVETNLRMEITSLQE
jgi:hypothetical protein